LSELLRKLKPSVAMEANTVISGLVAHLNSSGVPAFCSAHGSIRPPSKDQVEHYQFQKQGLAERRLAVTLPVKLTTILARHATWILPFLHDWTAAWQRILPAGLHDLPPVAAANLHGS
jgi:hypothetical protein